MDTKIWSPSKIYVTLATWTPNGGDGLTKLTSNQNTEHNVMLEKKKKKKETACNIALVKIPKTARPQQVNHEHCITFKGLIKIKNSQL